jgi:hypothetical protein
MGTHAPSTGTHAATRSEEVKLFTGMLPSAAIRDAQRTTNNFSLSYRLVTMLHALG